ncbi:SIR2 family protein [Latilactobacillus sakei]|uniref:SIR2 family protein n=1 Tax=Latilactobacillus sakei TaxID=1599 RepID=UPI003B99905B
MLKDVEHKPKIFVGQDGFFSDTSGWGELFKIHGSISAPSSIILNTEDYKIYDKNSILISAKIIATMIYSPILFLGYSLTDRNIKKLLADFSSQIPSDDARNTSDRIIVVEYEQKNNTLAESITTDSSRQLSYTHISTNNYIELYKKINSINEGLTPYEIMKYTDAIKQLVVTSGAAGSLESVLLSPTDLDNVVDDIDKGKPIVVAMGDNKYIFVNPTTTSYLSDYILEKFEILPENALRFIAREQQAGRYPFLKHYMDCNLDASHLEEFEKKNLASRYTKDFTNLNSITDTINKRNRIECKSIQNILELSDTKLANKIDLITYNSAKLNYNELDNYVKNTALPEFNKMYKLRTTKNSAEKSAYRKLFVAWDILTFGKK